MTELYLIAPLFGMVFWAAGLVLWILSRRMRAEALKFLDEALAEATQSERVNRETKQLRDRIQITRTGHAYLAISVADAVKGRDMYLVSRN